MSIIAGQIIVCKCCGRPAGTELEKLGETCWRCHLAGTTDYQSVAAVLGETAWPPARGRPKRVPRPALYDGLAPSELDAFRAAMDQAITYGWPDPPEVRVRLSELED